MKTKKEFIEEAYGGWWSLLKDGVDMNDGSVDISVVFGQGSTVTEFSGKDGVTMVRCGGDRWIPKGLEEKLRNNGWYTKFDVHLIKDDKFYRYCENGEYKGFLPLKGDELKILIARDCSRITHFKESFNYGQPIFIE